MRRDAERSTIPAAPTPAEATRGPAVATAHDRVGAPRLIAFYDSDCPLCSREIAHYQRLDRAGRVDFVAVAQADDALAALGIDAQTALRRMHVQAPDGRLLSGVAAFIAIWQRLPGYRLLARLVLALRLTTPLERLYARFADWRFARRCAAGVCRQA